MQKILASVSVNAGLSKRVVGGTDRGIVCFRDRIGQR